MQSKGQVKVKSALSHAGTICGDASLYTGQILTVLDIAVDGEGYLVLNKDNSGLGDIHKNDVEWFKPALPDPMPFIHKILERAGTYK